MSLDLSAFLTEVKNASSWEQAQRGMFQMLSQIEQHVNNGFEQLGVSTMQKVSPPDPPEKLDVKADNGTVQFVVTHNAPISKNQHYFVEADTDPSFSRPHVTDLGASRTGFTTLPHMNDNGDIQPWHFRTYVQKHGSEASEKINFGEKFNPTPVAVGGATQFTPLGSTGSGTAAPDGQQGGLGLGRVFQRGPVGPKRTSGT
jgi:hypothetical protein